MTEHIDRDALREEARGAIADGSYDGAEWASYTLILSDALDQAEARIKAVRDVLEVEERSVANLDIGACGIEDGWSAAVPTSDIRRALEGP